MNPMPRIHTFFEMRLEEGGTAPFCLTTVSTDGFPNSRFVDLKSVTQDGLLFGTDERSAKAIEFRKRNQVAACLWWERLSVQIRVQGTIRKASSELSDRVFAKRNVTAQAIATVSIQSGDLLDEGGLKRQVAERVTSSPGGLPRPGTWWVFEIVPVTVEILEFSEDRIHQRTKFTLVGDAWTSKRLNP